MDNQQREGSTGGSGAGDSVSSILPSESVLNRASACGAKGGCFTKVAESWTRLRNRAADHLRLLKYLWSFLSGSGIYPIS